MEEDFKEHCDEKRHRTLLLSVDVQGLKAVNDNINHEVGDEALKWWGDACKDAIKGAQTCKYTLFRPGGDESPTTWRPCVVAGKEPAEHHSTPLRLAFRPRKPNYALWARVGGGGGHRLEVSGCRLLALEFCDPASAALGP